jgi:hypothetical protein
VHDLAGQGEGMNTDAPDASRAMPSPAAPIAATS